MRAFKLFLVQILVVQAAFAQSSSGFSSLKTPPSMNSQGGVNKPVIATEVTKSAVSKFGASAPFSGKDLKSKAMTLGPGSTGGGDSESQEIRAIITSLPQILRTKGLQYFPEVKIQELEDFLLDPIYIERNNSITVRGAQKALRFTREHRLIEVNPTEWQKLSRSISSSILKQAIVFHEVLGLMGKEKNDDYTISNRLISAELLSAAGVKGYRDQIVPQDNRDPQIIYWRIATDESISFFHCTNRHQINTCRQLGSRSYSKAELEGNYNKLYETIQKNNRLEGISSGFFLLGTLGPMVLLGMGLLFVIPGAGFIMLGLLTVPNLIGAYTWSQATSVQGGSTSAYLKPIAASTKQISYLKEGNANVENFYKMAVTINQYLNDFDSDKDVAPPITSNPPRMP